VSKSKKEKNNRKKRFCFYLFK